LALFLVAVAAIPGWAAAPRRTVLVMGDSLSAGLGIRAEDGWVSLVAKRFEADHSGWTIVNASISGETTSGGAARIAAALAREQPAVVVIELGANDGLRGLPLTQMRANLEAMIRAAQGAKAKVLLVGMRLPPNYGPDYTAEFERSYSELAAQYKVALVPFLLAPIAADRSNFQDDNLHPVAAAQPKLRDHVWQELQKLLR
jgi:acyl-CoA thioesterase-1